MSFISGPRRLPIIPFVATAARKHFSRCPTCFPRSAVRFPPLLLSTAVVAAVDVSRQTRRRPPPKPLNKRDGLAGLTPKPGQSRYVLLLPSTSAIKQIQKRFCFTTRGSQRPDVLSPSANKSASSRASYPQRQRKRKWPTLSSMTTAFRVPRSKSACSRHRSARDGTTGSPWNLALSSPKARSSTLSGILTSPGVPW